MIQESVLLLLLHTTTTTVNAGCTTYSSTTTNTTTRTYKVDISSMVLGDLLGALEHVHVFEQRLWLDCT